MTYGLGGVLTAGTMYGKRGSMADAKPGTADDPPSLLPVAKIWRAARMIQSDHGILSPDHAFWGPLADFLNVAAGIPAKNGKRPSDWADFHRAKDIAAGYLLMSSHFARDESRSGH